MNAVGLYHDKRKARPWIIRWYGAADDEGQARRYSKAFIRKRDALAFQAEKQSEFDKGGIRDIVKLTLRELCEKFIAIQKGKLKPSTMNRHWQTFEQLQHFFGADYPVRLIRREDAERFIATRSIMHPDHKRTKRDIAAGTRERYLDGAKSLFTSAVNWEYLKKNPFVGIQVGKRRKKDWYHIKPVEFQDLLEVTPELQVRALYCVMYGCGLRPGEAYNLLWNGQDVDFERERINITNRDPSLDLPSFHIKDYELRSISAPGWVMEILLELQANSPERIPFLFIPESRYPKVIDRWREMFLAGRGKEWESRMLLNNVNRNIKFACRKIGITTNLTLTTYNLRKSYGQNLADAGTPINTTKELMGHSSIETTAEYYLKTTDANEERACQALDKIIILKKTDARMTPEGVLGGKGEKVNSDKPLILKELGNRGDKI